jgi:hypothetical protein
MSEPMPKPLASVSALRLHLKQLERGVNDARSRRLGPPAGAAASAGFAGPAPHAGAPRMPLGTMGGAPPTSRPAVTYPLTTPSTAAAAPSASGKPKAKPKSGADFGAFFGNVDKRAAG